MHAFRVLLLVSVLSALAVSIRAVSITTLYVAQTEDFNSLATATGSAVPSGWSFIESGSGANTTYGAGNGSSTTGNTFSFGATGDTERALGSLRTSSLSSVFGTVITNLTGVTLTELNIQYVGEQWRLGATGRTDRLDFAYSLDASSLTTGIWIDFDPLDLVAPVTTGVTGALDGNAPENQLLLAHSISGLTLEPGFSVWLRWSDFEATGSDDGLAIDNFSIAANQAAAQPVPEHLPLAVIAPLFAGLLLLGSSKLKRAA